MDKNTVLYVIAALLLGFIGGFLLANAMNRSEINNLRTQTPQALPANSSKPDPNPDGVEPSLTDAEIKAKIADADKNPTNFEYQKDLGTALYKYSSMKSLPDLLPETVRILERADSLNNKDFDVIVALGDAHFDMGFAKKDGGEFQKARELYTRALAIKPGDPDVQTDNAITWFVQPGPDYAKAAGSLEKVIATNPKHTRAMEFLAQAYLKMGRTTDAQKVVDKIKSIDPN
ncbi:MAG: tetratricopeptide repeat protein, partial [Acidobacteria bacterium]|nr:tetratricopeptide repeat protein [Acidobacteriota bacterium]